MNNEQQKPIPLGGEPAWQPGQPSDIQHPQSAGVVATQQAALDSGTAITSGLSSTEHLDLTEHKPLHFPTQRPNEHVVLLLRRNWTVLARDVLQLVASLAIPPIVLGLLYVYAQITVEPGSGIYALVVIILSLYYLFSFLAYFHDFVDYHLDIWVVTDQRIVSIEQSGLFNRVVSELNILRVQDVTSEVKGSIQTFLDYGQVHIQTAGSEARFVFEQVPHPTEVAKVILQVHDRAQKVGELEQVRTSESYRQQLENQQFSQPVQSHVPQQQIPVQPTPTQVRATQPGQVPQPQVPNMQPVAPRQMPQQAAAPRMPQSVRPEDVAPIQTPPQPLQPPPPPPRQ